MKNIFFCSFLEIWKWMAVLLSQRIIRVDSCLLIRYLAMHALSNDQTFNQSWSLSAVGELELVLQYPRYVIMLNIDGEFNAEVAIGAVL